MCVQGCPDPNPNPNPKWDVCAGLSGLELDMYSKTFASTLENRLTELGLRDSLGISIEQVVPLCSYWPAVCCAPGSIFIPLLCVPKVCCEG